MSLIFPVGPEVELATEAAELELAAGDADADAKANVLEVEL